MRSSRCFADIDTLHPLRDLRHKLRRGGVRQARQMVPIHVRHLLRRRERGVVADLHVCTRATAALVHRTEVDHHHVHADLADHRVEPPADFNARAVRQAERVAVCVARAEGREQAVGRTAVGSVVRHWAPLLGEPDVPDL
jgi:hypothetical protein